MAFREVLQKISKFFFELLCVHLALLIFRRNNVSEAIRYLETNDRLKNEIKYYREDLQVKMPSWILFEVAVDLLKEGNISYESDGALKQALKRYCANPDHGVRSFSFFR